MAFSDEKFNNTEGNASLACLFCWMVSVKDGSEKLRCLEDFRFSSFLFVRRAPEIHFDLSSSLSLKVACQRLHLAQKVLPVATF